MDAVRRRSLVLGLGLGAAATLLIIGVVACGSSGGSSTDHLTTGTVAASASSGDQLPKVAFQRFDGSKATFAEYVGKPLVINFWASTCKPCIKEMPAFEQLHQKLGTKATFIGVNVNETKDDAMAMVKQTGVTYDLVRDPEGDLFATFKGIGLPTTVVVDAKGAVVETHTGAVDVSKLATTLAGLGAA